MEVRVQTQGSVANAHTQLEPIFSIDELDQLAGQPLLYGI